MMPTTTPTQSDETTAKYADTTLGINAMDEIRKAKIIDELYRTGMLGGTYFGKVWRRNPIKHYILCCLYKQRLVNTTSLIEDCYNEMFLHLCKMSAAKICEIYDVSPNKIVATALKIISLKCFAIDPRYGNPKHSLIQSILFASGLHRNHTISPTDSQEIVELETYIHAMYGNPTHNEAHTSNHVIESDYDKPSEFEAKYGTTVEAVINALDDADKATFYDMIGAQPRGKESATKREVRAEVLNKIRASQPATPSNYTGRSIDPSKRKFKGSIYE